MRKTATIVRKLFLDSDTAQLSAQEGLLNVSALAEKIRPRVEKLAMKSVEIATIRIALYRLLEKEVTKKQIKPKVQIDSLTLHSNVTALTYSSKQVSRQGLAKVLAVTKDNQFLTFTQGVQELTIIASSPLGPKIINCLGKPIAKYSNLVAVTAGFDQRYLTVPNMIYTLFSSLAVKHINVMEIVSTLTSLTFVVYEQELNNTVAVLKKHLEEN